MTLNVTEDMKAWATPVQATYIDAIIAADGDIKKAAKHLGRHHNSLRAALALVRANSAAHGVAPEFGLNSPVPPPFIAKGHSTLERVGPGGERTQVLQWTKTRLDDQAWAEQIKSGIEAFLAEADATPGQPSCRAARH